MRMYQEKNKLIQKCKLKFNSFINEKNAKNKLNSKDYNINITKQNKHKYLNKNKKSITTNNINNQILKNNKDNNFNNINRNNKYIEPIYFDDYENTSKYINRSNYIIKVKTKIKQNEKNLLIKNINNIMNLEDINYINNNLDKSKKTEIEKNSNHLKRLQLSNNITRKNKRHFNEFHYHQNFLEKIKFIQLWWKTIFQIIKIQKHLRGFLYRQRLIEELDKEEIAVDNLLFLIKSYKKIVFNIFIFRLKKFRPGIKYYILKWNEKINKAIILKKLIETYNNKNLSSDIIINYDEQNTSSDIIKFEYDCDKIDYLGKMNESKNMKNNNNNEEENRKLSIENFSINKNNKFYDNNIIIPSINDSKSSQIRKERQTNNSNDFNKINYNFIKNKFNKIVKAKKITKNRNVNDNHRNSIIGLKNIQKIENDYIKNKHISSNNQLILSCNNKMPKKIIKNNNIIFAEENKSEQKTKNNTNNIIDNKFKRNKISNKLVSKEIIPFSMNNNFENNSDVKNYNSLTSSKDIFKFHNKKLKIYENHLNAYIKENKMSKSKNNENKGNKKIKNNKNIEIKNLNKSTHLLKKNIILTSVDQLHQLRNNFGNENNYSYPQNPDELSINNINTISSFNTSFLNSIQTNNKITENIIKYFKCWHNIIYKKIIKNKLRSLFMFSGCSKKIEKKILIIFFEKLKIFYNNIIIFHIKIFFIDSIIKITKKALIKCFMHKYFNKYKEIIFKKIIIENLIKSQKKIYNEIEKDIKNFNNQSRVIFNYPRKKVIINNQNQLFIHINSPINKTNNLISENINKSMLNLIPPLESITINNNSNIEYNYTEENQQFNFNKNNFKKKDIIAQMNQLTMIINLIEQKRIKNRKKYKEILMKYFQKWKKFSLNNLNSKNIYKNNFIKEHTFATDFEELTQYTINENFESESDLATQYDNLALTSSSNNNLIKNNNKYIPVRWVKCFHGKIKHKINNKNDKKYKISDIIGKYQTNTILSNNNKINNTKTFKENNKNQIIENNIIINDNFKTSNDYNNFLFNKTNNIMKIKDLIQKTNEIQKNVNSKNIYHRKTLGATLKNNNIGNNNISRIDKTQNLHHNDRINSTLDNYGRNFLGILNNATFLGDCKIDPLVILDNEDNTYNKKENQINESFDVQKLYGFKKLNEIEEREIYFFPIKNNNLNIIKKNKNENNDKDNSIVNMIKKYYNESIDIYNIDEQKKKYNSFIIYIFNNNIILNQKEKNKRSKSK